ncbi:sortase B protein-sorting domain-containing protein [Anaerofustis butyriciformans]
MDSVKTSDENNMGLYMLLSFISLAGVIGIGIGLKKKQSNL